MWDKIWGYIKQVASMTSKTEKNTDAIARIREELKEFEQDGKDRDAKMDAMVKAFQRFAIEYEHDRENAETEREMQRLRLEVLLLQAGHRLPPGQTPPSEIEMLREMVEQLRRENAELQRLLEKSEEK